MVLFRKVIFVSLLTVLCISCFGIQETYANFNSHENGSFVESNFIPSSGNVSISLGSCTWSQQSGSSTTVTLTIENASLIINGVSYTSSTSIFLAQGSYPYSWTGSDPFSGSGAGTLVVGECVPSQAEASVSIGSCSYSENEGSSTPVTISLLGAELTINGITYFESTVISLPQGIYPYTWNSLEGYTGSGTGSITVFSCAPKDKNEVAISIGACVWTQQSGALTPVSLTITGASLLIVDSSFTEYGPFTTSQVLQLPPGAYVYSFNALDGYEGEGEGSFTIDECSPSVATVSILIETCGAGTGQGSLTQVRITLNGATVTIDGKTYPESIPLNEPQEIVIYLSPGIYVYTWNATDGFEGSGSGELVVGDCTPKQTPTPSFSPPTGANNNPYIISLIGGISLLVSISSIYFWKKYQ